MMEYKQQNIRVKTQKRKVKLERVKDGTEKTENKINEGSGLTR